MSVKQEIIERLKAFTGENNTENVLPFYNEYRRSVMEKLTALEKALPSGDFNELYQYSHALKGISEVAGYRDMWEHAARFVEGTRAKDMAICRDEFAHISRLAEALEE